MSVYTIHKNKNNILYLPAIFNNQTLTHKLQIKLYIGIHLQCHFMLQYETIIVVNKQKIYNAFDLSAKFYFKMRYK